jgi:membrane-associated phospholipid phosphatase
VQRDVLAAEHGRRKGEGLQVRAQNVYLRRSGWLREVGLYLFCYLLAEVCAWLVTGSYAPAVARAHRILAVESWFGLDFEIPLQHFATQLGLLMVCNYLYVAAQFAVVPVTLVWLYRRRSSIYLYLRNTVIGCWLISVPIYAVAPTAPPRLSHIGLQDALSSDAGLPVNSNWSQFLYNPFAAFPSLHVGFALAVSIAMALLVRHGLLRALALTWGPLVSFAVIATGNHFVLDCVAGGLVAIAAFGLGLLPLGTDIDRRVDRGVAPEPS